MALSKLAALERSASSPKARSARPVGTRQKKVRFLIVCEGTKTEPNYFRALIKDPKYSVINADLRGAARSTVSLVKEAVKIKQDIERTNGLPFDSVWVVFDEDGNADFNEAVRLAMKLGFKAAWSNEAFELWYLLHFQFLDTGIDRHAYIDKLNAVLRKKSGNVAFKYQKNQSDFYSILQQYGDESKAKHGAKMLRERYAGDNDFSSHKPCTMVDLLVDELQHPERLL